MGVRGGLPSGRGKWNLPRARTEAEAQGRRQDLVGQGQGMGSRGVQARGGDTYKGDTQDLSLNLSLKRMLGAWFRNTNHPLKALQLRGVVLRFSVPFLWKQSE